MGPQQLHTFQLEHILDLSIKVCLSLLCVFWFFLYNWQHCNALIKPERPHCGPISAGKAESLITSVLNRPMDWMACQKRGNNGGKHVDK